MIASTWRTAIEEVTSVSRRWYVYWRGRRHDWCEYTATSMGEKMYELEKETGSEAKVILSGDPNHAALRVLRFTLVGVGTPDNEDWATNGKAPWSDGDWREVENL